jgi:hypothetical protein
MYGINVKNIPCFSILDGMLMVSVIFLTREDLGSKLGCEAKHLHKTWMMNDMWIF